MTGYNHKVAVVAQLVEQLIRNQEVGGSIPPNGNSKPMLLISNTYDQNEMKAPPFSVAENEVLTLYGARFNVKQLYNQPAESILAHLLAKGVTKASEEVYYLSSKKQ